MLIQRADQGMPADKAVSGLFLTDQPSPPGACRIPKATEEVLSILTRGQMHDLRVEAASGDSVSPHQCLEYMQEYSSIHLACHGSQHPSDPRKSKFKFHLGDLDLGKIMQTDLRNADFAFLSACKTGTGDDKLSNEAFHLAAGMLAAGYRRVVATMWSIKDDIAPQVSNDFYDFLWSQGDRACAGGGFDGTMSAYALHHALRNLRRRIGDSEEGLLTWVPYVHYGY